MREIVIISGKGGTGKTSIVASFAALAENKVLADCDVDAADLHLVLEPKIEYREPFSGGKRARILPEQCTACGICQDVCRFEAVSMDPQVDGGMPHIDPIACEGCGVCARACPSGAIAFEAVTNGEWFISRTRCGPLIYAKLGIAEENSGKLVTLVRKQARELAEQEGLDLIIADGSPGIGCPVIASLTGADLVVVVTEPTLSGRHDLGRVADLTRHFHVPTVVCINKWDLNEEVCGQIEEDARSREIGVVGRVRYDNAVTKAQIAGLSVVEHGDSAVANDIRALWREVE